MEPRDLDLIHVRVQTWFPLQIQVYLNGHEWLARRLTQRGIEYTKIDNVFIRIGELPRAQRLADRFAHLNWPRILNDTPGWSCRNTAASTTGSRRKPNTPPT